MPTTTIARVRTYLTKNWRRVVLWVGCGVAALLVLVVLAFYFAGLIVAPTSERSDQVVEFIHDLGDAAALVSVAATTTADKATSLESQYARFIDRSILDAWKADPTLAFAGIPPGARVAAIRVKSVRNVGILTYLVKAYLKTEVPVTIPGLGSGVAKGEFPVTFGVAWRGAGWKVIEYSAGHASSTPQS